MNINNFLFFWKSTTLETHINLGQKLYLHNLSADFARRNLNLKKKPKELCNYHNNQAERSQNSQLQERSYSEMGHSDGANLGSAVGESEAGVPKSNTTIPGILPLKMAESGDFNR